MFMARCMYIKKGKQEKSTKNIQKKQKTACNYVAESTVAVPALSLEGGGQL